MIGQKGLQGTMTSCGQPQHSEHSPHTLRRGNKAARVCTLYISLPKSVPVSINLSNLIGNPLLPFPLLFHTLVISHVDMMFELELQALVD